MTQYDVDSMIQAADLETILTELGLEPQRRKNKNGFELYVHCFNPEHDDSQRKMSMAEEGQYKGLFYCWKCKFRGNIIEIVQHFLGIDFKQALSWMQTKTGVGELLGTQSLIYKIKKEKLNYGVVDTVKELPTFSLPDSYVPCGHNDSATCVVERYLKHRGINEQIYRKFQVGMCSHDHIGQCLVIPIRFDGEIRSIFYGAPHDGGLKRYPKDAPQGDILFNYEECLAAGRYVLVESVLDVLRLDSLNLGPAMACFTNMVSNTQVDLLKSFPKHAVFPDMDSKYGWDLVTRLVKGLDKSVELILPPIGKDPGDCTDDEIVDAYARSQSYSNWEVDHFMPRLAQPICKVKSLYKK